MKQKLMFFPNAFDGGGSDTPNSLNAESNDEKSSTPGSDTDFSPDSDRQSTKSDVPNEGDNSQIDSSDLPLREDHDG